MFDMELAWDRPAHIGTRAEMRVVRVRLTPRPGSGRGDSLPLRMALALDTSGSMEGKKLEHAKSACEALVGLLRPQDRLWLASFSTRVRPLLDGVAGGPDAASAARAAVQGLLAAGVTRADLALEYLLTTLPADGSAMRVAVLVTDGHPTDPRGRVLEDLGPLISQASEVGSAGISLWTVGLGSADDFNTAFLLDLCERGGGAFLYAAEPSSLEAKLRERLLRPAQAVAEAHAKLVLRPLRDDVVVAGMCRFRPEYTPMDAPQAGSVASVGMLRADGPTDLLISVQIPPLVLGESPGPRDVLEVRVDTSDSAEPLVGVAAIQYTNSFGESQKVNQEVNQDRLLWDIRVYSDELVRTKDPNRTGELLTRIEVDAVQAGREDLAQSARQQLEELHRSGKLSAHATTGLLDRARQGGGNE